jgi:hypothetical protein
MSAALSRSVPRLAIGLYVRIALIASESCAPATNDAKCQQPTLNRFNLLMDNTASRLV